MSTEDIVMTIDKPHFVVKVQRTVLQVDLKEGVKKELEDVLEARPGLRDSLGFLFQTIIPLDVKLRDIESVYLDKKGRVKVVIPSRRDIVIPLEEKESQRLIAKLNELIPPEKERALRDKEEAQKAQKAFESKQAVMDRELYRGRVEK